MGFQGKGRGGKEDHCLDQRTSTNMLKETIQGCLAGSVGRGATLGVEITKIDRSIDR